MTESQQRQLDFVYTWFIQPFMVQSSEKLSLFHFILCAVCIAFHTCLRGHYCDIWMCNSIKEIIFPHLFLTVIFGHHSTDSKRNTWAELNLIEKSLIQKENDGPDPSSKTSIGFSGRRIGLIFLFSLEYNSRSNIKFLEVRCGKAHLDQHIYILSYFVSSLV